MSSPANDIAKLLEKNGYGVIGKSIYTESDLPPRPNRIITVYEVNSFSPPSPNLELSEHYVQIMVRSERGDKEWCRDKMEAVNDFLHGANNLEVDWVRYVYSFISSGPAYILADDNMRPAYSTDYRLLRTKKYAAFVSIVLGKGVSSAREKEALLKGIQSGWCRATANLKKGIVLRVSQKGFSKTEAGISAIFPALATQESIGTTGAELTFNPRVLQAIQESVGGTDAELTVNPGGLHVVQESVGVTDAELTV